MLPVELIVRLSPRGPNVHVTADQMARAHARLERFTPMERYHMFGHQDPPWHMAHPDDIRAVLAEDAASEGL